MQIDRKHFFDETRKLLKTQKLQLTQAHVDALEFLLSQFEKNENWRDQRHIAYALATTAHETAWTFEPIIERGAKSYFNKYEPGTKIGKDLGNTQKGDGYTFRGRGYVQLTGRKNYERYGIENAPDMALDPYRAFDIMTDGMFNGRYTGKSFANYINASKTDYVNARRIINGTDKAKHIADIAIAFKRALKTVKPSIDKPATVEPVVEALAAETPDVSVTVTNEPPSDIKPAEVTSPEPYQGVGFWAVIKKDLAVATGGNLSFATLQEYAQQASGWPEWLVGIITKLAVGVLIATFGYFVFRVVHYGVDTWKKSQKAKTEAQAASDPTKADIKWV